MSPSAAKVLNTSKVDNMAKIILIVIIVSSFVLGLAVGLNWKVKRPRQLELIFNPITNQLDYVSVCK